MYRTAFSYRMTVGLCSFATALTVAGASAMAAPTTYVLVPLFPTKINSGGFSFGYEVSNTRQVAGSSSTSVGVRGTVWNADGTDVYLQNGVSGLGSGGYSRGLGNNDNGWTVGGSSGPGAQNAGVWKPDANGVSITVQSPLGSNVASIFYNINNSNVAVGQAGFSNLSSGTFRASTWTEAGGMVRLPDPNGGTNRTEAHDINNAGVIVGEGNATGRGRALRWSSSSSVPQILEPLVGPGAGTSTAWSVNENGYTIGWGTISGGTRPTIWDPQGNLFRTIGNVNSYGYDINNALTVVGQTGEPGGKLDISGSGARRGFVYTPADGFFKVEDLIDPNTPNRARWEAVLEANSVNEEGVITGFAIYNGPETDNVSRSIGYIAIPVALVPEPTTLSTLAVAGVLVMRRRRNPNQNA